MDMKTIFEKIIDGEIPSEKIYEDKHVIAILDIDQSHPGHALVIPKEKSTSLNDIKDDSLSALMSKTIKVAKLLTSNQESDHWKLMVNNGEHAGQEVFYTHVHIFPSKWSKKLYIKK